MSFAVIFEWACDQATEGHLVDALVPRGDEGRGRLRKATGSCQQALIRGYPNGETRSIWTILV